MTSNMQHFYHYTSKENWHDIQKSKVLLPRTHIYKEHVKYFSAKTKSIVKFSRYTVGFPKIRHKGWVECGLWDEIFRLIKCEVLLKIKIPNNSKGFVREHLCCSQKSMQQKYGEDIYNFGYSGKISVKDPRITESLHEYWNAVVPLSEYKDSVILEKGFEIRKRAKNIIERGVQRGNKVINVVVGDLGDYYKLIHAGEFTLSRKFKKLMRDKNGI